MTQDLKTLQQALEAAKLAKESNNCWETREAYKKAWNALSAAEPPMKRKGYASRAGLRQARERRTR